jgi:hypothetical protein
LAILAGLVKISWHSRGWWDAGKQFFDRCNKHMEIMEQSIDTLLTNHMAHIEQEIKELRELLPKKA